MGVNLFCVALFLALVACDAQEAEQPSTRARTEVLPMDSAGPTVPPPPQAQTKYGVSSGIVEYRNDGLGRQQTFYFDRYGAREAIYSGEAEPGAKEIPFDVSIYAAGTKVNYDRKSREGIGKIQPNAPGPLLGSVPDLRPLRLESIGARTIVGKPTSGVRLSNGAARMDLWMWRGIPLAMESITPDGDTLRMEATSIAIDVTIPAERFRVPPSVTLNRGVGVPK